MGSRYTGRTNDTISTQAIERMKSKRDKIKAQLAAIDEALIQKYPSMKGKLSA